MATLTSDPSTSAIPNISAPYERGKPWLEDGNVVLVAQRTAFRVLRSILSECSEIFRDMFAVPQPPDGETLEGCPVVQLSDAKQDVEFVLSVLFSGGRT